MKRINTMNTQSMCVQPTFLIGTYDGQGVANFAPITWVSVTWDETSGYMLVISMNGVKKTKQNLQINPRLSANLVSCDMLELLDFLGLRTGIEGPKQSYPYGVGEGAVVKVPTLDASRWVYECEAVKLASFGDTDTYICPVKNVQVADMGIDLEHIDLTKLDPVVYSGDYHSIGKHLGAIGDFEPMK